MTEFVEEPKEIKILDENGKVILEIMIVDFEASWMHKYNGKAYLFNGDTHLICYWR
jgi:hypothetical protein